MFSAVIFFPPLWSTLLVLMMCCSFGPLSLVEEQASNMVQLSVLYGTETGTSEEAAEGIAQDAVCRSFSPVVVAAMDDLPVADWASHGIMIFVCATTGQGNVPSTMKDSWDVLRMTDAPDLEGLHFAVFGLGDSTYARFNYAAKMLHNRLVQLGATPVIARGLGDDQDPFGYECQLSPWLTSLWAALNAAAPRCTPTDVPPKWEISVTRPANRNEGAASAQCVVAPAPPRMCPSQLMRIASNDPITAANHFQEVRRIELDWRGLEQQPFHFACGDALAIFPTNPTPDVEFMLNRCSLQPDDQIVVTSCSKQGPLSVDVRSKPAFINQRVRAFDLFACCLDICGTPSRSFFKVASRFATDPDEAEKLLELSTDYSSFLTYSVREKRTVVEVLTEFPSVAMPLPTLVSLLRVLRPRQYSIASPPGSPAITLAMGVVQFSTPYKRKRRGLCSAYLAGAAVGSVVQCFPCGGAFTLPEDPATPLVLVGTGTGVAPLRSIALHCAQIKWKGPIWVFVGHRFRFKDFLFANDWEQLVRDRGSQLIFHPSFSRERESTHKKYVQHEMVAAAKELSQLIHDSRGYVFLSGNAKKMPVDVQDALISILSSEGCCGSTDAATTYVSKMRSAGRYVTDTWV